MAKSRKAKHNLPGSIYKNGNRWWWKVQLPGEAKTTARPLKPFGSSMAATDYNVAVECDKIMTAKAVFDSQQSRSERIEIIAELCKPYMEYVNEGQRDSIC